MCVCVCVSVCVLSSQKVNGNMSNNQEEAPGFKLILIGDGGAGKKSLIEVIQRREEENC